MNNAWVSGFHSETGSDLLGMLAAAVYACMIAKFAFPT
jgi:hypothetical protein